MAERMLLRDSTRERLLQMITSASAARSVYLPSERRLAEELGVSRDTLRVALEDLEREGLITREQGRGTRILAAKRPEVGTIAVVFGSPAISRSAQTEMLTLIEGVATALGRRGVPSVFCFSSGFVCDALGTGPTDTPESFAQILTKRFAGALLFEWMDAVAVATRLDEAGFPYVVGNLEEHADVRSVRVDVENMGRRAAELMASCGYRRALCLIGRRARYWFQQFVSGFEGAWSGEVAWVECPAVEDEARRAIACAMRGGSRPDVIFAYSDERTLGAMEALREEDVAVPGDVGLIGYGGANPRVREMEVAVFREPTAEIGREAVRMLTTLCLGETVERTCIVQVPFVPGRTLIA